VGLIAEKIWFEGTYGLWSDFEEFIDKNTDAGEDDYDFTSVGQGIRSKPNRARGSVNFHGKGNYEDVDEDLDSIKLKIPNF